MKNIGPKSCLKQQILDLREGKEEEVKEQKWKGKDNKGEKSLYTVFSDQIDQISIS